MKPTRIRDLIVVAVVAFIAINLLIEFDYGSLPGMPTYAGLVLLVLALVDGVLAYVLRPRSERRRGPSPISATNAVRVVALAKASSLLGAIMFGAWCGLLGYVAPRGGRSPSVDSDIAAGIVGAACAVLLVVAALWLERHLQVPPDRDEQRSDQDQKP